MIDLGELVRVAVKTIVKGCRADRVFVDIDTFVTEELPYQGAAGAYIRLKIGVVDFDTAELMVVDDGNLRGGEETDVSGTILAVSGDKKIAGTEIGNAVLDRDPEHFDHHGEVNFSDLVTAGVDQTHIASMTLKVPVKCESGSYSIWIRIIMTLYCDVPKLRQIRQFHVENCSLPPK